MQPPVPFGVSKSIKIRIKVQVSQPYQHVWMIFRILKRFFKYLKLVILPGQWSRQARKVVVITSFKWTKVKSNNSTWRTAPDLHMEEASYLKWTLKSNPWEMAQWHWGHTSWSSQLMKTMLSQSLLPTIREIYYLQQCGPTGTLLGARAARVIPFLTENCKL